MTGQETPELVTLTGSQRHAVGHTHPDAVHVGAPEAGHPVRLVIVLKPRTPFLQPQAVLDRAAFLDRHGAREATIEALGAMALRAGLAIERSDAAAHTVVLTGTLAQATTLFRPEHVGVYRFHRAGGADGETCLGREGAIAVPEELADEIVAVMGYDGRPVARTQFRHAANAAAATSYTPPEVAARYGFPGTTAHGSHNIHSHHHARGPVKGAQTIGLIELGGGYAPEQMAAYFKSIGIDRTGHLVAVPVAGGSNAPDGNPNGADGEVQLDIQVAGSVAPAADLAVYFAPNQGNGFYEAITTAVHDTANAPDIISISWGGPESSWSDQDMTAMDQAFQSAVTLGISVCVASGDNGADDGTNAPVADFPASSPNVLACGGTSLPKEGPEVAWNDGAQGGASGGGFSTRFMKPSWQTGNTQSMRGVPDVSGNADPETGYNVSVDGQASVIGGTSAVAPLWAALIALCNAQSGGKAGLVASVLYRNPDDLNDITEGNNDGYEAGPGWDPVTGLGSPKGTNIAATLSAKTTTADA